MSTQLEKEILEANENYAKDFKHGDLPIQPSKKAVLITCMDARLDPAAAYGFSPGSVIVIRNAGASARDAARSALLCGHLLGAEEFYVVKHTGCGMLGASTELVHEVMKKNLGASASTHVDAFDPIPIEDLRVSAQEDVTYLRQHPLALKQVRVTGWIYTTETGRVEKVIE